MTAKTFTPARRKALDVLRRAPTHVAAISNVTSYGPPARIYWQTARWLIDSRYARHPVDRAGEKVYELELTALGLDAAHKAAR